MPWTRRDALRGAVVALIAPTAARAAEPLAAAPAGPATTITTPTQTKTTPSIDIGQHFRRHGLKGTFVLLSVQDDTLLVHNPSRADEAFLPASTFKIPNSLIALETGAVRDESEVLKWDGQKRAIEAWNKDQDMRTAIAASTVWFYQEVARRIGEKRMQEWVDRIGYGNRDISGGIDRFWLDQNLRMTARQQIEFLRRLQADELPFSERTRKIVKDILILERTHHYTFRGKTGWAGGEPNLGWFVGWIECGERAWIFALNVDMPDPDKQAPLRKPLAIDILTDLGLMEAK